MNPQIPIVRKRPGRSISRVLFLSFFLFFYHLTNCFVLTMLNKFDDITLHFLEKWTRRKDICIVNVEPHFKRLRSRAKNHKGGSIREMFMGQILSQVSLTELEQPQTVTVDSGRMCKLKNLAEKVCSSVCAQDCCLTTQMISTTCKPPP